MINNNHELTVTIHFNNGKEKTINIFGVVDYHENNSIYEFTRINSDKNTIDLLVINKSNIAAIEISGMPIMNSEEDEDELEKSTS